MTAFFLAWAIILDLSSIPCHEVTTCRDGLWLVGIQRAKTIQDRSEQ